MKIRNIVASIAMLLLVLTSCDDTVGSIGSSLNSTSETLHVSADTFDVDSRTVIAGPVLSRSSIGYLGAMKDPETGSLLTSNFMTQFHALDNFSMPEISTIYSKSGDEIIADSCEIRLYYNTFEGDSLSQMKLTMYEMDKPMNEGVNYYTNFDPLAQGYIRTGGIAKNRTYTIYDLTEKDAELKKSGYVKNIRIMLNDPYTDKEEKTYSNYGTFLMRSYYDHPEYFRDSYQFAHHILPGFYFKMTGGVGSMAHILTAQINVYYRTISNGKVSNSSTSFASTEEVLIATHLSYNEELIAALAAEKTWTYLKSPAGLFTELTLPVEKIVEEHEKDSINGAKIQLPRINSKDGGTFSWGIPQYLLMIPVDSVTKFFEGNKTIDNKYSYLSNEFSSSSNKYEFNNISGLINMMNKVKQSGKAKENWNKVVLIPVRIKYNYDANNLKTISRIEHDLSMTSTRLVGGSENVYEPLRISIIYSKFNGR